MAQKVLFVCLGNICRSPAAEGIVRHLAPELETDSAGTAAWHVGKPPYHAMQEAIVQRGLDISDLRARQFTSSDYHQFDLIIVMDSDNQADVESLRPPGSQTPVSLFTDFAKGSAQDHVPDPYYTRDFDGCLDLLEQAAHGLKAALSYSES
ncbi:phosphotyrosine protein phosphatase [Sedimentitalea sp. CY04]|uniref:protein-tyrosine-phosphatase n=1 Tax=Parasedimentitalea denitrificans TaxID=2211118 RepID=A0ABX0W7X7_9RHOB|nr:low molecular weight protein-tyrosine-phosphatase [Sedimentitalea sp. CY04]NIZ61368.1 phosphotyrosine protein phosphatase [Sedimentitalea sp. CY04]